MKKVYIKDSLRNIKKKTVPFISVAFVTSLAIMAFLGIEYGAEAIRSTSHDFYKEHNFRDIEIYSSKYLSAEDIDAISGVDGVKLAEGVMSVPAQIKTAELQQDINVVSLTEKISTVQLLDGRMPENADECVIERELLEDFGLKIGDTVNVTDHSGKCPLQLKNGSFTIVGKVHHPDHYLGRHMIDESRYILANDDAFDRDALLGRYTKAVISADISSEYYSDEYYSEIDKLKKKLTILQDKRRDVFEAERTETLISMALADAELKRGKTDLDSGSEQLEAAKSELSAKEKELEEARQQLIDSEAELNEAEQKLLKSREELDSGKSELLEYGKILDESKTRLDVAAEELADAEKTLSEKKKLLDNGKKKLDAAEKELRQSFDEAERLKESFRQFIRDSLEIDEEASFVFASPVTNYDLKDPSLSISDFYITNNIRIRLDFNKGPDPQAEEIAALLGGYNSADISLLIALMKASPAYIQICKEYDEKAEKLESWENGHQEYIKGYNEYQNGLLQYEAGKKEYESSFSLYEQKKTEYQNGRAEYENALAELNGGDEKYSESMEEYKKYKAEYDSSMKEYNNAVKMLEEAEKEIRNNEDKLDSGRTDYENSKKEYDDSLGVSSLLNGAYSWCILDTKGNAGFYAAEDAADGYVGMAFTFGVIFLFVGALVLFSTISRMIADQQKQIGTIKALGFRYSEILGKYMFFALSAVISGIVIGVLAAYFIVQKIHIDMNLDVYVTRRIDPIFDLPVSAVAMITGIIFTVITVFISCSRLLKQPARSLLTGSANSTVRRRNTVRKSRMPLYFRLILRNMRTDWQRVLVTVTSIAGCCVLMIVGLTFSFTLRNTVKTQFNDIILYDAELVFDPDVDPAAETYLQNILEKSGCGSIPVMNSSCILDIDNKFEQSQLICVQPEDTDSYIELSESSGSSIVIPEEGILISHTIARAAGLSEGDSVILYDTQMKPFNVQISGVFNYYLGKCIIVSEKAYADIFNKEPVRNQLWVNYGNSSIPDEVNDIAGFVKTKYMADAKKSQNDYIAQSDKLAWLLIILAGVMSFLIILDLVNMYVMKKKRELIIMRINGFPLKNTVMYAALECIVTTLAGIVLGTAAGIILADIVVSTRETPTISFIHRISLPACLISVSITAAYSFFIHYAAFTKIKKYKITNLDQNE